MLFLRIKCSVASQTGTRLNVSYS